MPERLHGRPWAITLDGHETIVAMVQAGKIEAASFDPNEGEDTDFEVSDSIALIPVSGALQKQTSRYFFWLDNDSTYAQIRAQVQAALDDTSVKAICLKVASPGGDVDGIKELSDFLHRASKGKSIYAYADGQMCSAAYWISSVAKEIAAPATAQVGSIGVRTMHVDRSKAQEEFGYKVTYITAGKYKAMGTPSEPLDKESKAYIQDKIDRLYTIFIDDVARNRGVDTDKALAMADGKVFLAQEAQEVGLIDRVEESFETFLTRIKEKEEVFVMEYGELQAKHPDLFTKVKNEGKEAARNETAGLVTAETERILGIATAVLGKEEGEKLSALVSSGATVEQIAAFNQAMGAPAKPEKDENKETATRENILKGIQAAHSQGVKPETGADDPAGDDLEKQASALVGLVE